MKELVVKECAVAPFDHSIPLPTPPPDESARHVALFYESGGFLVESIASMAAANLRGGLPAILIATRPHLDALARSLETAGIDVEAAKREQRYVAIDASDCLSRLLVDGLPNEGRFDEVVGGLMARTSAGFAPRPVWAFGEMVNLLVADGKPAAALRLEELWNQLARRFSFTLVCGYALREFQESSDEEVFSDLCREHQRVIPAESYSRSLEKDRSAVISRLQQKAVRLEKEVARRERVERDLHRQEDELEDFFENGLEGLQMVGRDGKILRANRALLTLLGYSREEYVGHHVSEFHTDSRRLDALWQRLERGEAVDEAVDVRCRDGSIRTFRIACNARLRDGALVNTRCFLRDVTEQVRLERELEERCAQLAEADRRKDEFLAMLGHELRNPLFVVQNALELIEPASAADRSAREIALRQSEQLGRLLDDLLDVGRVLRGHIRLRRQPLDLREVIRESVESARLLFERHGHELSVSAAHEPLRIEGDATRLEQVIVNLLSNAATFTPLGGKIELSSAREGSEAVLRVRDTGIGMDSALLARVFEPFSQACQGLDRSRGGLGVGLTIVKQLVELHGGRVEAASGGEGKGSAFTIRLPLAGRPEACEEDSGAKPGRPDVTRLIVVEDNPDLAATLRVLLERSGYDVRVFHEGMEAIRSAKEDVPDLMLVDIGLPGIDGYEVAKRLRLDPAFRRLPLIALTGYGAEHDASRALAAGFDQHLVKPLKITRLRDVIEAAIGPAA